MAKETDENIKYRERLPFTFTVYNIKDDVLTIDQGFFKKIENDCYMYKVQDVEHTQTFFERLVGLGTITCFTGDTTHPKLIIEHVKRSREIKNYILEASEAARMRRRTLNTLNIGTETMDDMDND